MSLVIGSSDVGAILLVFRYDFVSGQNLILACRVDKFGSYTGRPGFWQYF